MLLDTDVAINDYYSVVHDQGVFVESDSYRCHVSLNLCLPHALTLRPPGFDLNGEACKP